MEDSNLSKCLPSLEWYSYSSCFHQASIERSDYFYSYTTAASRAASTVKRLVGGIKSMPGLFVWRECCMNKHTASLCILRWEKVAFCCRWPNVLLIFTPSPLLQCYHSNSDGVKVPITIGCDTITAEGTPPPLIEQKERRFFFCFFFLFFVWIRAKVCSFILRTRLHWPLCSGQTQPAGPEKPGITVKIKYKTVSKLAFVPEQPVCVDVIGNRRRESLPPHASCSSSHWRWHW